jgi:dTDP-4-amino-4,6-dideoxygalactose transaminase
MLPLIKTRMPDREKLMPALEKVLYSGYIAQGEVVDDFERKFERFIGGGYSLSLNSGTAALHIALILAGVMPGDEVISTAMTAEPTNVAIKMVGAKIRWADIDYETGNISPVSIESVINKKTKAIVVVDYAGTSVDVKGINEISVKYSIPVIHDAAHALGTTYNGKKSGNHFPFTVFSFQAIKHLTTIDGGVLHFLDKDLYERGKLIRWFGLDKKLSRLDNDIQFQGFKYHMNNVNATIGLLQLETIEDVIEKFKTIGKFLDLSLKDIPNVEIVNHYPNSESSYWLYTLKVKRRADFIEMMNKNGYMASEIHKRNDWHSFLNDYPTELPILNKFYDRLVHIPCGWWVSLNDCEKMVDLIKKGW